MAVLFFSGVLTGIAIIVLLLGIISSRVDKSDKTSTDEVIKNIELMGSIKYRFAKAQEITEQQLNLISQADRPSASAAHSKHKNDLIRRLKDMESEKVAIFRTILADGVDPNLTIMVDGEPTHIKMSEAVLMHDNGEAYPPSKTETKSPQKNGLRLVHNEENSNESSSPEVP
jgi:hypothetical protein